MLFIIIINVINGKEFQVVNNFDDGFEGKGYISFMYLSTLRCNKKQLKTKKP